MKLFVASDTHLDQHPRHAVPDSDPAYPGCNSRAAAGLRALRRVYEDARDAGSKFVVVAGDVFHRRGIVPVPVLNAFLKMASHHLQDDDVTTVLLPGNHDYVDRYARWEDHRLHGIFAASHVAAVVDTPQLLKLGPLAVGAFIPYTPSREVWKARAAELARLAAAAPGGRLRILFAHQSFSGAVTGPHEYVMREGLDPVDDIPEGFDVVISGHYHMHQITGGVVYVGGLLQHDFGEREYTPGHLVVDTDTGRWRHHENSDSPRFALYEGSDDAALRNFLRASAGRGDYVRVVWKGTREKAKESMEVTGVSAEVRLPVKEAKRPLSVHYSGASSLRGLVEVHVREGERARALPEGVTVEDLVEAGLTYAGGAS